MKMMIKDGINEVIFKQRSKRSKGGCHAEICGNTIVGRRSTSAKSLRQGLPDTRPVGWSGINQGGVAIANARD